MRLENINSLSGVLADYKIALILETIRSECAEVPGFLYLGKKCYFAEQLCETDLFKFKQDSISGASSEVIAHATEAIKLFKAARITEVGDAVSKTTRNYCGEECRERVALIDEQIVNQYLRNITDNEGFERWQKAIDDINRHRYGKDWHVLSIAAHMHSRQLDWLRAISEMRRQARENKVSLPEGVFKAAMGLLYDLNLHPE